MPIDPGIVLSAQPAKVPTLGDFFARSAQIQAAQQENQIRQMQLEDAQKERAQKEQWGQALQGAYNEDGSLNEEALFSAIPAELMPTAMKFVAESRATLQKWQDEQRKRKGEIVKDMAEKVAMLGYHPTVFGTALKAAVDAGALSREEGDQAMQSALQGGPEGIRGLVDRIRHPEPQKPIEVSSGETLVDPITRQPIYTAPAKPEKKSFQAKEVMVGGRPMMANFDTQTGQYFDATGKELTDVRPVPPQRQAPTTRYQAKEVLNDAGKPVMANFDALTGQYIDPDSGKPIKAPRPVPSAMEMMDARKFQKASPVLDSISSLSEKINTGRGAIAKASGAVERAKAQVNLNDDVAEYEALVSGFTPLVARSLGHTGVLTQQDVDSVKALFPRPGDSKSLRDRKIARMKKIIGELEAVEGVPGEVAGTAKPGSSEAKKPTLGFSYDDYLKAQKK